MARNDVETRSNRGQWENSVEVPPELSQSYASCEEAVEADRELAERLGSRHEVRDSEPTGAITDPDPAAGSDR